MGESLRQQGSFLDLIGANSVADPYNLTRAGSDQTGQTAQKPRQTL